MNIILTAVGSKTVRGTKSAYRCQANVSTGTDGHTEAPKICEQEGHGCQRRRMGITSEALSHHGELVSSTVRGAGPLRVG